MASGEDDEDGDGGTAGPAAAGATFQSLPRPKGSSSKTSKSSPSPESLGLRPATQLKRPPGKSSLKKPDPPTPPEGSKTKGQPGGAPASSRKEGSSSSTARAAQNGKEESKKSIKGSAKSGVVKFETVYEYEEDKQQQQQLQQHGLYRNTGDSDQEDDDGAVGYTGATYDYGDEEEEGVVPPLRPSGKAKSSSSRHGHNKRSPAAVGPSSWADVDEADMDDEAASLVQTVNRFNASGKDTKLLEVGGLT